MQVSSRYCFVVSVLMCFVLSVGLAAGQERNIDAGGLSPEDQAEVDYINGLNAMRLPQYAQIIIDRHKNNDQFDVYIKVAQLQALIAVGNFDEVKRIIAAEPDQNSQSAWGMKLTLGDGYYAWGRYGEAQGVYEAFFKAFPDGPTPAIRKFYLNSAYKYSQMLLLMDKKSAALTAYRNALKAKPEQYVKRQLQGEMAELMIQVAQETDKDKREPLYKEMEKLIEDILWVQDIWFGKGIVLLAQMREMKGDIKGCKDLLEDKEYIKRLNAIDQALKEEAEKGEEDLTKLSPMANCRYLIGDIMLKEARRKLKDEGKTKEVENLLAGDPLPPDPKAPRGTKPGRKSGALQHFVNVYAKYPNSMWAPDAVQKAEEVKRILEEEFGAEIKINIDKSLWDKIKEAQFQEARNLFRQNQFKKAIDAYVRVLNRFPEDEISVAGLSELIRSYVETENDIYAQMVISYMAERFGRNQAHCENAGNRLIGIAIMYEEKKQLEQRDVVYDKIFEKFPGHSRTAALLYSFGDERYSRMQFEPALKYYSQIAEKHPQSPYSEKAKSKMAFCYSQMGEREKEIDVLKSLVDELGKKDAPGEIFISAKFRLAVASMMYSKDIKAGKIAEKKEEKAKDDSRESAELTSAAPAVDEAKVKELAEKYQQAVNTARESADNYTKTLASYKKAVADKDAGKAEGYKKEALDYRTKYTENKALAEKYKAEYEAAKSGTAASAAPAGGAEPDDPAAKAEMHADRALEQFAEVVALLTDQASGYKYAKTDEDRDANQKVLEGAMFYEAMSYVMKNKPENKLNEYRQTAIKKLEALVERFPKSKFGPPALSQVGTLYTILEDAAGAEKALRKLQSDYPDTPEAKMSDFALAINLLELGRKQQAKAMFKKMLGGDGKYTPAQIQMAGEELMKAGEHEIAADAFKTVLEKADTDALKQSAMVNRGESLLVLQDFQGAMNILEKLLNDYPLGAYTVKAAKNLAQAASEVAMRDDNYEKRFDIFNKAVAAIKKARKFDTSPGFKAESEVIIGRIDELKMEAENRYEEPGFKTRAEKNRNKAVGTYQMIITFSDINDPTVKPHVEEAYARCWPLLADMEKWDDLMSDADKYLEKFVDGKYLVEARNWKNRARGKAAAAGVSTPVTGETPVPASESTPETPAEPEAESAAAES